MVDRLAVVFMIVFLLLLGGLFLLYRKTDGWTQFGVLAMWVQAIVLGATLVYLFKYVRSTEEIADATTKQLATAHDQLATAQQQLALAQEPVVVFDMLVSPDGLQTHPTLTNVSSNHARCRVKMEIKVKGIPHPMGATWDGTWHGTDKGWWPVQAHRSQGAWFPTASIARSEAEFQKLLDEQLEKWNKTGGDDNNQITATVSMECQRLDGVGRTIPSGPFRYYYLGRAKQWTLDFPWPR